MRSDLAFAALGKKREEKMLSQKLPPPLKGKTAITMSAVFMPYLFCSPAATGTNATFAPSRHGLRSPKKHYMEIAIQIL
jgi:hypothetical protein